MQLLAVAWELVPQKDNRLLGGGVGRRIVYAWIITIPASAAVAALVSIIIKLFT